jgi:3-phosphoshikimate 1-carboxyvinyltransferase
MSNSNNYITLFKTPSIPTTRLYLPSSKSESNRALIINALTEGSGKIINLSTARDTQTLKKLLGSIDQKADVLDAGTTMRFLTAYYSITCKDKIITGTKRMLERPIGILVDALRKLGADISYLEKPGYPPLHFRGYQGSDLNTLTIRGDISSQYISALLMISPILNRGLTLELAGEIGSRPYIEMTLGIMNEFGIESEFHGKIISIAPQKYKATEFTIAPDWSGASYWYSTTALSENAEIELKGFRLPSLQGDSAITSIMEDLGVVTSFSPEGMHLSKSRHKKEVFIDFKDSPDLAQTIAIVCAAKGIKAIFTGLESLRIKETDRISALQNELSKMDSRLIESEPGKWQLIPGNPNNLPEMLSINTYDDHRMAMAFAPLATLTNVRIEKPEVVQKSYPSFWEDMKKAGFSIE